eukprot:441732-Amphidinium_carterae.1
MSDAAGRELRRVMVRGERKGGTCAAIQLTARPVSRSIASGSMLPEVGVVAVPHERHRHGSCHAGHLLWTGT